MELNLAPWRSLPAFAIILAATLFLVNFGQNNPPSGWGVGCLALSGGLVLVGVAFICVDLRRSHLNRLQLNVLPLTLAGALFYVATTQVPPLAEPRVPHHAFAYTDEALLGTGCFTFDKPNNDNVLISAKEIDGHCEVTLNTNDYDVIAYVVGDDYLRNDKGEKGVIQTGVDARQSRRLDNGNYLLVYPTDRQLDLFVDNPYATAGYRKPIDTSFYGIEPFAARMS